MKKNKNLLFWIDIITFSTWGVLFIKYWVTGELFLLIHPNYFWIVLLTGSLFILISILKALQLLTDRTKVSSNDQHLTLFAPGWSSALLLFTVVVCLIIPPRILSSQAAQQRGVSESLPGTRTQAESFKTTTKPETRSLIDWVRTLNAYPEPDAYVGQKAKVSGFVVHLPNLDSKYLLISRFIITCCAVDAYPVGIPVKLNQSRDDYPPDTWLEIEGRMITETLPSQNSNEPPKRQLVIEATSLNKIPTPRDPYGYQK